MTPPAQGSGSLTAAMLKLLIVLGIGLGVFLVFLPLITDKVMRYFIGVVVLFIVLRKVLK